MKHLILLVLSVLILQVGQSRDGICYLGMPSENVFSILGWKHYFGYNLFFSTKVKTISIYGKIYRVVSVNAEQIILER